MEQLEKLKKAIHKLFSKVIFWQIMRKKFRIWKPSGHYYSPIPSIEDIKMAEEKYLDKLPENLPSIDLNYDEQKSLIKEFSKYYEEMPYLHDFNYRYNSFLNGFYEHFDATILYSMIRHLSPSKIIEVGSGYSSAIMLDLNEKFYNNSIDLTFVEPYPEMRLNSLIKPADKATVIKDKVQNVDITEFEKLNAGDILFIDSSHVIKAGNDLHYLMFEVLPKLNKGVVIHFHDVFYPFDYCKDWLYEGRAWNEAYLLRAFLQFNKEFKIKFFNSYTQTFLTKELEQNLPITLENRGQSIWIERV